MSVQLQAYTQFDDMSTGNMSRNDILIQLSALQSDYEEKHDAIRMKEYGHIPQVFRSSYKENALNNLEKSTFEKAKSIIRNAGKYVSEATEWNIQHDRRQGKSWYDAVLSAYDAALSQELANNPPKPPEPPKPKERETREITVRDISREIDSYKAEYPDDEIDRQTAIQRIINGGRERGIDYIMPVPQKGQLLGIDDTLPMANPRIIGIDLPLLEDSHLNMLYGLPNQGKSIVSIHTVIQFANAGFRTWLHSNEDNARRVHRRISAMLKHYDAEAQKRIKANLSYTDRNAFKTLAREAGYTVNKFDLLNPDTVAVIEETIDTEGIEVFFIDPIRGAHSGKENSNDDVGELLEPLRNLADNDMYVFYVHHANKSGDSAAGAGAFLSRPDTAFEVVQKSGQIVVTDEKQKDMAKGKTAFKMLPTAIDALDDDNQPTTVSEIALEMIVQDKSKTAIRDLSPNETKVVEYLREVGQAIAKEISEGKNMDAGNLSRILTRMVNKGILVLHDDGNYSLNETEL